MLHDSQHLHSAQIELHTSRQYGLEVDPKFSAHFAHLKQVFLYVTDKCDLRCHHCLYKASLILEREMEAAIAARLLVTFRSMGAFKLTFIGGEATRYGIESSHRPLLDLIQLAHEIGYNYIRLDTNGHFPSNLLGMPEFRLLDELSISIDGYNAATNDSLRGDGAFEITVNQLRQAVKAGYRVHVTACATRQNVIIAGSVANFLEHMIRFCEDEKIEAVNFHGVFRMGVPMDTWTEGTHLEPQEWLRGYETVAKRIQAGIYSIPVRLPRHLIERALFERAPQKYGYCPCKLGERVLVHPDGIIRICSSLLCTPYGVARYTPERIIWETVTNELYRHDMNSHTPCTNQQAMYTPELVPLCFSFKPGQTEPVWRELAHEGVVSTGLDPIPQPVCDQRK
ncbi:MAG: radical SAM protein [Coprothermobacterota bacterium]|nr:radical SAM protein [Coprothermobacterota bacterium]